jgi:murein DD-endopeptidase MepM/ murein hydrolase activator NlpD
MPRRLVIIALAVAVLLAGPATAHAGWRAPTSGSVTRGFDLGRDPFAPGQHRGADFAAAPGSPVRAVCSGRVVVAARIGSSGGVVTLACGGWRVSHLPLARISIREGGGVAAGDSIGTAASARAHAGIHVGVRRAGDRFGYVDPLRFIDPANAPPPAGPPGRARRGGRPTPAPITLRPVAAARPLAALRPVAAARPLAPWPVWVALAGLLLAAVGGARLRFAVRTRPDRTRADAIRARAVAARHDLPP